jgi:hypothetical protein
MTIDDDEQSKISKQADDYERSEGDCFSKALAIRDRDQKILVSFILTHDSSKLFILLFFR